MSRTDLLCDRDIVFISWSPNHRVLGKRTAQFKVVTRADFGEHVVHSCGIFARPFHVGNWELIGVGDEHVVVIDERDDIL